MGGHLNIYTSSDQHQRRIFHSFCLEESSNLRRGSFPHGLFVKIPHQQSIATDGIGCPPTFGDQYFASEASKNSQGKLITEEDWSTLRPDIYRLYVYIHDNLTFPKVREALNLESGFKITKRQFKVTRKVEKWGFRKNFRKHERQRILKDARKHGKYINDSRFNTKIVERLQRRSGGRESFGMENHSEEMPWMGDQSLSQMATKMVEEDPGHQSAMSEKISKSDDSGNTIMTGTDDSWPFSDATDGSFRVSWLAELFGRLGIADIIASASLENENQEDLKERKFITRIELRGLSSSYNGPPACPELKTAQQHSFTRNFSSQDHNPGFYQSFWIPMSEIDVFPMSGTLMAVARRAGLNHPTQ